MFCRWIFLSLLALNIDAFVTPTLPRQASLSPSVVATRAFWRHWIPETDRFLGDDTTNNNTDGTDDLVEENAKTVFFGSFLAAVFLLMTPQVTVAVSGGGLDFAGLDVSGKDYSNSNYKGKDFTQVIAKGTTFAKSNLQGCRFYKAYLVRIYSLASSLPECIVDCFLRYCHSLFLQQCRDDFMDIPNSTLALSSLFLRAYVSLNSSICVRSTLISLELIFEERPWKTPAWMVPISKMPWQWARTLARVFWTLPASKMLISPMHNSQ